VGKGGKGKGEGRGERDKGRAGRAFRQIKIYHYTHCKQKCVNQIRSLYVDDVFMLYVMQCVWSLDPFD